VNAKFLAVLALAGGLLWYLFGRKPGAKGVFNPFKTTGSAAQPPQFGLKPANSGGFGRGALGGDLGRAFGAVGGFIGGLFTTSARPRSGPGTPDIVEGPNGVLYRNTGDSYVPYASLPTPLPDEPGFTIDNRDFSVDFGDDPFADAAFQGVTLPDTLPDIGGGLAPDTGFPAIDVGAVEGLA
jgi:hypothetical protein